MTDPSPLKRPIYTCILQSLASKGEGLLKPNIFLEKPATAIQQDTTNMTSWWQNTVFESLQDYKLDSVTLDSEDLFSKPEPLKRLSCFEFITSNEDEEEQVFDHTSIP